MPCYRYTACESDCSDKSECERERRERDHQDDPEMWPDFEPDEVRRRFKGYLKRNPQEDAANLRARRLRSAVVHTQRVLKEHPDITAQRFGWAWFFLQDQVVCHACSDV